MSDKCVRVDGSLQPCKKLEALVTYEDNFSWLHKFHVDKPMGATRLVGVDELYTAEVSLVDVELNEEEGFGWRMGFMFCPFCGFKIVE